MLFTEDRRDDCVVVGLTGHLDLVAAPEVRRRLLKAMTDQPVAVICDLHRLNWIEPACAAVFPTAWRESGGWPAVSLSMCCPTRAVMSRLRAEGTPRYVAVHRSMETALAAARALPPYVSRSTQLRFDPEAAREARTFLTETCRDWEVEDVLDPALLVLSEIVVNGTRYGAPPLHLVLRLRNNLLRIAVSDGGSGRPHPHLHAVDPDAVVDGVPLVERGHGLSLVVALSTAWGVSEPDSGLGKTVWSELRIRPTYGPYQ